jgi:uncharacterized RDD family membrane protein YckC
VTSPFSPYQAPATDELITEQPDDGSPQAFRATRAQRWWAAFVDGLFASAILGPLQYKFGMFANFPHVHARSARENALWGAVGLAVFLLVHGYFLFTNSQTVGKRLLGIRIENFADYRRTPGWKILLVRYLPTALLAQIPVLGPFLSLLDIVFIFRKGRRCLHDHLAGTIVMRTR